MNSLAWCWPNSSTGHLQYLLGIRTTSGTDLSRRQARISCGVCWRWQVHAAFLNESRRRGLFERSVHEIRERPWRVQAGTSAGTFLQLLPTGERVFRQLLQQEKLHKIRGRKIASAVSSRGLEQQREPRRGRVVKGNTCPGSSGRKTRLKQIHQRRMCAPRGSGRSAKAVGTPSSRKTLKTTSKSAQSADTISAWMRAAA